MCLRQTPSVADPEHFHSDPDPANKMIRIRIRIILFAGLGSEPKRLVSATLVLNICFKLN